MPEHHQPDPDIRPLVSTTVATIRDIAGKIRSNPEEYGDDLPDILESIAADLARHHRALKSDLARMTRAP